MDIIQKLFRQVIQHNLSNNLFFLAKGLQSRTLNFTMNGHAKCTLYKADDFIKATLKSYGYDIDEQAVSVQVFVPDKTVQHGFRKPGAVLHAAGCDCQAAGAEGRT